MFLRQFLDPSSSTFTYVLACNNSKKACIIDPVLAHTERYIQFISEWQLTLLYTLETHTHADHITAASALKDKLNCQILIAQQSQAKGADDHFNDNDSIPLGELSLKALYTPGHTDDCYSFLCNDCVFTGDTLMIRATGRTDFQCGDARLAYHSITNKLLCLPDATRVYPGHDYKTLNVSTILEEKKFNPRLQAHSAEEYASIMDNLNLARPKKMDTAIPANLSCGNINLNKDPKHVE